METVRKDCVITVHGIDYYVSVLEMPVGRDYFYTVYDSDMERAFSIGGKWSLGMLYQFIDIFCKGFIAGEREGWRSGMNDYSRALAAK